MTRRLTALAVAAAAFAPVAPATALPPDCERYGDKPCIVFCEIVDDTWDVVAPLFVDPLPPKPVCA